MRSKILFLVEGEKEEPRILGNNLHGLLSLIGEEYEIVTFANDIYELYEAYVNGKWDDLVSFLRHEKGLVIDDNILSVNAFSAIYLVFDLEPQDDKYSVQKIKEMLKLFNNETEYGKLYINYPMVESYYYLKSLPDLEYNERTVSLEGLNGKKYKKEVNLNTCLKKNNLTSYDLCYIIMQNYNKARYITNSNDDYIDSLKVLNSVINRINLDNEVYVLSSFPFILIDYNLDKTRNIINKVIYK